VKSHGLVTVSLDLGADDVLGEGLLASEKEWVMVCPSVASSTASRKSVKIQLPLKARILRLIKESRHDGSCENLRLVNLEGTPMAKPRHDRFLPFISYLIEHAMEFEWKRIVDTAARASFSAPW